MYKNYLPVVCLLVCCLGCIKAPADSKHHKPFEVTQLDACLNIVVDMSGSFAYSWDDQAYKLFLELMDQFFTEQAGEGSRVVICQLSGNENVVLFEGRPDELRAKFRSPEALNQFLQQHSDPTQSLVYRATSQALDYAQSIPGVTDKTRLLTVILSDMHDTESDPEKQIRQREQLSQSLKEYQQLGGGLALYFVSQDQIPYWKKRLTETGFEPGMYVIESHLVAKPQLPRFE